MEEKTKTTNERLMAVQAELKAPKSQKNTYGGYSYRSCEDILEAVKPLLAKHGLLLTITDEIALIGDRHYVEAIAKVESEAGGFVKSVAYAREPEAKKGMDASQITGTASSYARKYALNALFLIDDTKDADALPPDEGKQAPKDGAFVAHCKVCNKRYRFESQDDYARYVASLSERPCCPHPDWVVE